MGVIYWTDFDWPSFATLATGAAAVTGATIVGFRQAGIARRQAGIAEAQNTILQRQTEIEAQKLKAELFERRLATFEATADFIMHFQEYGRNTAAEGRITFLQKLRESQFLFEPSVHQSLLTILDRAQGVWLATATMQSDHQDGRPFDLAYSRTAMDNTSWLFNRLETLADVFRPDLRLDDLKGEVSGGHDKAPKPPNSETTPPKRRTIERRVNGDGPTNGFE